MNFIVLYKTYIFKYIDPNKLGQYSNTKRLHFIKEFHGTNEEFTSEFQKSHPTDPKMIFMHKSKPLRKDIRLAIEKSEEYRRMMRDSKLSDILSE